MAGTFQKVQKFVNKSKNCKPNFVRFLKSWSSEEKQLCRSIVTFYLLKIRFVFNLVYFITTCSITLKIMKNLLWLNSCLCSSLKKFQVHVLCASVWIYLLFNCFSRVKINAFDRRLMLEKFGWHACCFQVKLVIFVARSCLQVRVLLIFCPSFALFFISLLLVVYFHACVTLAKQVSVLIHAALSKFSSFFRKETLQAKMS